MGDVEEALYTVLYAVIGARVAVYALARLSGLQHSGVFQIKYPRRTALHDTPLLRHRRMKLW